MQAAAACAAHFSERERTQYVELINDKLRAVQIQDQRTFSLFASALRPLLTSCETTPKLEPGHDGISGCIEDLTEMLKEPEMYATRENFEEFRSIIRDRIAAKIQQLELLEKDEKAGQTYIEQQQKTMDEADAHLKTMHKAHAPLPDSEAHVVSEEESLRQQISFLERHGQATRMVMRFQLPQLDNRPTAEVEQITVHATADLLSLIWVENRERQAALGLDYREQVGPRPTNLLGMMRIVMLRVIGGLVQEGAEELRRRQQSPQP